MSDEATLAPGDFPDLTDERFRAIVGRWAPVTLLSVERLWSLYSAVCYVISADVPGAIVECGTYKGGSIGVILDTLVGLHQTDREIVLFDTFDGFPEDVDELLVTGSRFTRTDWVTENFFPELEANLVKTEYPRSKIIINPGRVEDTLPAGAPQQIALLHLDTDYYAATKHQLEHLYPSLAPGGFLQVDDYGHFLGCRRAVDEYFGSPGVAPICLARVDYTGRAGIKFTPELDREPSARLRPKTAELPHLPVGIADELFIRENLTAVPGWLYEPAGILTVHLLRTLAPAPDGDVLLEIGVYAGRYLSLMRHAGGAAHRRIIGMDTFQWIAEAKVEETLASLFGVLHGVELWQANSEHLRPADLQDRVAGRPIRFVSVDGDHAAAAVRRDMELVDSVLADDGIVAADDFMNPLAVGVTEGLGAFFATGQRNLVAFAYASNKLFLCRPGRHAGYVAQVRAFVDTARHLRSLDTTREFWTMHEAYFNQPLFGRPCLILTRGMFG